MVLATVAGRAAGGSAGGRATCGWTATSPSPGGCWRSACCGAGSSPPAAALLLQGLGGFVVGFTDAQSLAIVAPVTEELSKGLFLLLLLWWRRAELDGILDGIVYAGMVGIGFAFIENILYLAAAYNGTDGMGPGGTGGGDRRLRRPLPVQPVRPPAVHHVHRHRRRHRGRPPAAGSCASLAPLLGYVLAVVAHAPGTARRSSASRASSGSTSC